MNLYEQNELINQNKEPQDQSKQIRAQEAVDLPSEVEGVSTPEASEPSRPVANDRKPVVSKTPEWVDYIGNAQQYEQKVRQVSEDVNYGLTVTPQQYQVIANAMANSDDPEQTEAKFAQALVYSRELGIDLSAALENLDSLNKAQLGHSVPYTKAGYKAVFDSVSIGEWSIELAELKKQWYEAVKSGSDTRGIEMEINQLENVIEKHQDNASRGLVTTLLKLGAQSLPYTLRIFLAGGATGAAAVGAATILGAVVGGPAGAAAALSVAGTIYQKSSMVGGFIEGYKLTKYAQYYDLVKEGVKPEVAEWTTTLSAVIQSAVEQFLGIESGVNRAISNIATGTTSKILAGMYARGAFGRIAGVAAEYFKTGVSEGLEEFLQQLTEDLTDNIARELSGTGNGKIISRQEIHNAVEAFAGGFGASLVLGILPTAINTKATVRYAMDLREEAQSTDSKQAFINNHKSDEQFEGFSSKTVSETLSTIYDNARESGYDSEAKQISDKEARTIDVGADMGEVVNTDENGEITGVEKATSKQPDKPLSRTDDGRIVAMESSDVRENADGSEKHLLILGGTDSQDEYGRIEYTLDGKKVIIDRVATFQGYEDIQADGIKELMRRYEGYEFSWDPLTEEQEKIKQQLIEQNPLGSDKGLNWFDGSYDIDTATKVGNIIGKAFTNLTQDQRTTAAVLLEIMANSKGMSTAEYLKNYVQEFGSINEKDKRGGFKVLSQNENGLKAAIYAGKNADFSTFSHESFHLLRKVSDKSRDLASAFKDAADTDQFVKFTKEHWGIIGQYFDNIQQVKEAAKSFDEEGNWTRDQEELASYFFESYLQEGKTFSEKLKNLFRKISEWFCSLYNTLRHNTQLNDGIIKAFDSMLEANEELREENRISETTGSPGGEDGRITIGTQEKAKWDDSENTDTVEEDEDNGLDEFGYPLFQMSRSKEYQTTEKRLKADKTNFDSVGNHLAPNGKISNLSYSQWVTARTPSFIRWFGDWMKKYRIEKLRQSEALSINTENDKLSTASSVSEITDFLKTSYQGNAYTNKDTGKSYIIARRGINKVTSHTMGDAAYVTSLQHIPELIENAIYITSSGSKKENSHYQFYDYYVLGLKLDGEDYTAKLVMGLDPNGEWYYDQGLTQIEKGALIGYLKQTVTQDSLRVKDTTLLEILQENFSKIVDENGEPKISYRGDMFWEKNGYVPGLFVSFDENFASNYGQVEDLFINARNPFDGSTDAESLRGFIEEHFSEIQDEYDDFFEEDDEEDGSGYKTPDELIGALRDGWWTAYEESEIIRNEIIARGYDAIKIFEEADNLWLTSPSQAKSATRNAGSFNEDDPSILYQKEKDQTISPTFKAWFGDWENDPEHASKVVDENGSPMVMYHGTNAVFRAFDKSKAGDSRTYGHGFYFTSSPANALTYGHPLRVFLQIFNPVKPGNDTVSDAQLRNFLNAVRENEDYSFENYGQVSFDKVFDSFRSKRDLYAVILDVNATAIGDFAEAVKLFNKVNGTDYDGIMTSQESVVFEPTQIKSSDGNVGTFSREDPDMYYQSAFHGSGASFDEFLEEKINSGQGSQSFGYGFYFSDADLIAKGYAKAAASAKDLANSEVAYYLEQIKDLEEQIQLYKEGRGEKYEALKKEYDSDPDFYKDLGYKSFEDCVETKLYLAEDNLRKLRVDLSRAMDRKQKADELGIARNLYKVEIPENNGENYFNWDGYYTQKQINPILDAVKKKLETQEERDHFEEDYGFDGSISEYNGEQVYNTIAFALGHNPKAASELLHEAGYVGIVYDAGRNIRLPDGVPEGTKNYVIFDPRDIGITRHWKYDTDDEAAMLYQEDMKSVAERFGASVDEYGNMNLYTDGEIYSTRQSEGMVPVKMSADMLEISDVTEDSVIYKPKTAGTVQYQFGYDIDQIYDYAQLFDTFQEFEEDVKGPLSIYSEEELDGVDLLYVWNKAHNLATEAEFDENALSYYRNQGYVSPATEEMDEAQKTAAFRARINTDEGVREFIGRLREIYALFRESGGGRRLEASNEADFEAMTQDLDLMQRIYREASPFIKNLMFSKKDEISDKAILEVRGMMTKEENVLMYRDLYADVMLDPNLRADIYNRQYTLNDPGFGYETKSISERARMFSKQDTADWIKKVQSGQLKDADLKKHIDNLLEERENLKAQLKDKTDQLSTIRANLSREQQKQLKMLEEKAEESRQLRNFIQKVQEKIGNGRRMTAEEFKKINSAQDRIALLNEEMKKLRHDDRIKAAAERREAVNNAVYELRKKYSERQYQASQAKALQEHKEQLARIITGKRLNDDVNWEQRKEIEAIAAAVDPHNRRDKIRVGGVLMTVDEVRKKIASGEIPLENVTDYMITRLTKTPLNEWTVAELEEMAEYIQDLRIEGKQIWQAKVDKRNMEAQRYRNQILHAVQAHKNHPEYTPIPNTPEAEEIERSLKMRIRNVFNKTLNMDRKAQKLDNNERGVAWRLLVDQRRKLDDQEYMAVQERIQPIVDLMKELGVNPADLYKKIQVALDTTRNTVMTVSDLAYCLYAEMNTETYEAVAYGDLVTQDEKDRLRTGTDNDDDWNMMIRKLGDDRYQAVKAQAQAYFESHPEQLKVFDAIDNEWQKPENFDRSNAVTQDEYNITQEKVDHYMRIYRTQRNGSEIAQNQAQEMMAKYAPGTKSTPKKGQTKARITISPSHQSPTRLDMLGTWMKSVEENEHLIAFTPWVRMMNRIFKNRGSELIRDEISATFGKGLWNDISSYISEVAVPSAFKDETGTDQILRTLRGGIYTGYLGAKTSSVVLQGITSPMPFLREVNPLQLAKGILQFSLHPKESWAFITELSPFMKRRSISPIAEEIRSDAADMKNSKAARAYHKFQNAMMQPLEWVDRWAVAGGWLACYEKKLSEFEYQNDIESMKKAAHYADTVVYQTQPNGVTAELSPMFKPKGAAWKTFVQFQTALNTIWQNVTYDTATDFAKAYSYRKQGSMKYRQYLKRALMTLAGYAFAGLMLQLVTEGFDDDDDKKDKARKLIYGSMTQFIDAVPLIGDMVNAPIESLVTGERARTFSTALYPGLDKIANGMAGVIAGKDKAAAWLNLAKGSGLMTGFPVNGLNEWIEAISGKPEALLGRD